MYVVYKIPSPWYLVKTALTNIPPHSSEHSHSNSNVFSIKLFHFICISLGHRAQKRENQAWAWGTLMSNGIGSAPQSTLSTHHPATGLERAQECRLWGLRETLSMAPSTSLNSSLSLRDSCCTPLLCVIAVLLWDFGRTELSTMFFCFWLSSSILAKPFSYFCIHQNPTTHLLSFPPPHWHSF